MTIYNFLFIGALCFSTLLSAASPTDHAATAASRRGDESYWCVSSRLPGDTSSTQYTRAVAPSIKALAHYNDIFRFADTIINEAASELSPTFFALLGSGTVAKCRMILEPISNIKQVLVGIHELYTCMCYTKFYGLIKDNLLPADELLSLCKHAVLKVIATLPNTSITCAGSSICVDTSTPTYQYSRTCIRSLDEDVSYALKQSVPDTLDTSHYIAIAGFVDKQISADTLPHFAIYPREEHAVGTEPIKHPCPLEAISSGNIHELFIAAAFVHHFELCIKDELSTFELMILCRHAVITQMG